MIKLVVIGTGYVGLPAAIGFANFGCNVLCIDIDREKIDQLNRGEISIYETDIKPLFDECISTGRLHFSCDIDAGVQWGDVIFLAVGTPQGEDGSCDLSGITAAVRNVGRNLNSYKIIVTKSTVPVGSNELFEQILKEESGGADFDIVSNPEFLREGRAMYDFLHPDRVVLGCRSERPHAVLKDIYRPLYLSEVPFVFTDLRTAEMIKYAANCFLATKIAFINEMGRLCDKTGADVQTIAMAMGKDVRIGNKFLHVSPGFGGSCFPKDTQALAFFAREQGEPLSIVDAVIKSNAYQKEYMLTKIKTAMGTVLRKRIAVLGLSFKAETDDMRDSPAIPIVDGLLAAGAEISIFDPQAMKNAFLQWGESLSYAQAEYAACHGAEAVIILTEWNRFRNLDIDRLQYEMDGNFFFDLRNIYNRKNLEERGFSYFGIGR